MMLCEYEQTHLGFYVYDNQAFLTRDEALELMLLKHDYSGTIQFYYNDHVFSQIDWSQSISSTVSELYKLRAQQLRDKYNYLVLRFSGGSDSTQVLESFLKNNIFLDEIVVVMQEKLINKLDHSMLMNDYDLKALLEYEYAVIPYLKKIRDISPNTKISVFDTSDDMYDELVNKKFSYLADKGNSNKSSVLRFAAPAMPKSFVYLMQKYERQNIGKDNNVAVIRGGEKPGISIDNKTNDIIFMFSDVTLSGAFDMQLNRTGYTLEDFFWTPDFPLIPVKQSHMIADRLNSDKPFYEKFQILRNVVRSTRNNKKYKASPAYLIDRMYTNIIYPDWNPTTFTGPKPLQMNADFKLLDVLDIKHDSQKVVDEYYEYKMKKYEKISNKSQLNRFMSSRPYFIKKFNPTF